MFSMPSRVLACLASAAVLVSAVPTSAPASNLSPRDIDDLLLYGLPEGVDPATLAKRSVLQRRGHDQSFFHGALPGCGDDDDPSYADGKSAYTDGDGTLVQSGLCDNKKYTGGWHCWTDMFYTDVQIEYDDWTNTGGVIDCKTTSQCSLQGISLNQSCTANTGSWDNAIQVGAEGKLDEIKQTKWGIGGSFSYTHNFGGSQTFLTCNSVADQGSCQWSDQGCHAIWKGKRNRRVFGYLRRSCDTGREGTNMSQQRADGYFTIGMLDFDIVLPDNQAIGCAAMCNDVSYPDGTPANSDKVPFPGN
ncbi:hypothetical protein EJ04DRAFT_481706 [Polyplosphaeria fusca]|uniref:Uncharacterized protein n=1 Tax=Polyplosphaeria fusca TaxID=682080 RepID=A0A9P4V773_9PLEO|nr:hypothetical protein EJ04DRAFT_481706 [Polyplosphaeria fusca]